MSKPLSQQVRNFVVTVDVYLEFARSHSDVLRAQSIHRLPDPEFGRNWSRALDLWTKSKTAVLSIGWALARSLEAGKYPVTQLLELLNEIEREGGHVPPTGEHPSWPKLKARLQRIALRAERAEAAGADREQAGAGQVEGESRQPLPSTPHTGTVWLTVTEASSVAACNAGEISRAVTEGKLQSNGEKRSKRRIDSASLVHWILERAKRGEPVESDAAVEKKLRKAAEK
jgi:hypothetical protein